MVLGNNIVTRSLAAYDARTQHVLFACLSWTDGRILIILTYIIDIDETLKLTKGQGHKVKGQGQICIYVELLFFNFKSWLDN